MGAIPPVLDLPLRAWATTFGAGIADSWGSLGLAEADVAEFALRADSFAAALAVAHDPETRTKLAVLRKDQARRLLLAKARELVRIVTAHRGVSSAERVRLGLRARLPAVRAIPAPGVRPMVLVTPHGELRLIAPGTDRPRGRPPGVSGAVVYTKVGGDAPHGVDDARLAMLATRYRNQLPIPAGSRGLVLWVMARWYTERGEMGPVSAVVSTVVAA